MRLRCALANRIVVAASALLILSLILASSTSAAEPKYPALTGRVVDDANVLSASTQTELTDLLAAHERATGQQVVVVTLDSLQGFTIEDLGYQLGRHWGIGQKGSNTGALFIVAPKEHKVRIEVGYGLEGTLTDATSRTIIEQSILPAFRRGDFNAGIVAGTRSILKVLGGGNEVLEPGEYSDQPIEGNDLANDWMILIALVLWIVLVIILDHLGSRRQFIRRLGRVVGPGTNYGGGFGGGGFGSGGGGGGFSGGGGSFGGGGASGSW